MKRLYQIPRHLVVEAMWGLYGMVAATNGPIVYRMIADDRLPWVVGVVLALIWLALGASIRLAELIRNENDRQAEQRRSDAHWADMLDRSRVS